MLAGRGEGAGLLGLHRGGGLAQRVAPGLRLGPTLLRPPQLGTALVLDAGRLPRGIRSLGLDRRRLKPRPLCGDAPGHPRDRRTRLAGSLALARALLLRAVARQQLRELPREPLHLAARAAEFGLEPLEAQLQRVVVLGEAARAEQRAQQRLPLLASREQELLEAVLREQDDLQELLLRELHDLGDLRADGAQLRLEPDPELAVAHRELGLRLLRGEPVAARLRPRVFGRPPQPVAAVADRELELDVARVVWRAVIAAQLRHGARLAVVARHTAVQREADRVEDRGLPGPRLPADEEDAVVAERVEVDRLRRAIRSEARHRDAMHPHRAASAAARSATSSAIRADSASLGPSPPRTKRRNASISSVSGRPRPMRSR